MDKEFDTFSKERIDKNNRNPVPLEPSILIVNAPKNNLGTVNEDEEKHVDSRICKSPINTPVHMAYSVNLENTVNDVPIPNIKDSDPFKEVNEKVESVVDPLLNIPVETKHQNENMTGNNIVVKEDKTKHSVVENMSSLKNDHTKFKTKDTKVTFEERINEDKKLGLTENRPVLRDRSASIGALNLKTPIAQLIGEQNRTMLFQVINSYNT